MTGLREPAAKGAMLRGIKPTQTALDRDELVQMYQVISPESNSNSNSKMNAKARYNEPLEGPVVAALGGLGGGNGNGIVHYNGRLVLNTICNASGSCSAKSFEHPYPKKGI